ncbi:hypothetical protein AAHC03_019530 [Spirometra sp. Aus1]
MVAASRTDSNPADAMNNASNAPAQVLLPKYKDGEEFQAWLRRIRFHQQEILANGRNRALLKALDLQHLYKAFDAGLTTEISMDKLCNPLEQVLRPTLSLSEAINSLVRRHFQYSETPQYYAEDLLRFADAAYPTLIQADKEEVVLRHFLEGLMLSDLKHTFIMHPPIELQDAIARAK